METIFDHNVTEEEQANLYGIPMDEDTYKSGLSEEKAYEILFVP